MWRWIGALLAWVALALGGASCGEDRTGESGEQSAGQQAEPLVVINGASCVSLLAGQTIVAGSVCAEIVGGKGSGEVRTGGSGSGVFSFNTYPQFQQRISPFHARTLPLEHFGQSLLTTSSSFCGFLDSPSTSGFLMRSKTSSIFPPLSQRFTFTLL